MDIDGVDVSILYPTLGLLLYKVPDSDLLTAVLRTYKIGWLSSARPLQNASQVSP